MPRHARFQVTAPELPAAVLVAGLLDWYGELLTDRQRQVFHLYYDEDMSLGEIGHELGISRQAVYDQIQRGGAELARYEQVLGLAWRARCYHAWRRQYQTELSQLPGITVLDRLFEPGPRADDERRGG